MGKPVKILLLEDSEDDANIVMRMLQLGGVDTQHERAESAAAMRAALARESWDAVISDYYMPGFTGLDALGILKASGLDLPFILISGAVGEDIAVQVMQAGAGDYVMKNNLARLAPALKRELQEADNRAAQRQGQRALAESEHRLRTIIAAEPECVKVVDADGRLLEMNAAGLAMLEADSLTAVQSRPLPEFLLPEYRAAFVALHQRVMGGGSGTLEFEVAGLKGGRRWLETHAAPLHDVNDGAVTLLGITRDVTARKRADDALRESEARFRSLANLSSDWYWEQDEQCRFCRFSGGEKIGSWNADQSAALGLRRWELPGVMPVSGNWDAHKALLEARKPFRDFEYRRILGDGRLQYVAASGEPVFDASGGFTGYRGVATEITERKNAEYELQRFRMAMDASADSIYLTDLATMRFVYLNDTVCERLGYTREQLLQMGPQDVLMVDREHLRREFEKVIVANAHGMSMEHEFVRSDGTKGWTELRRRALHTTDATTIVSIGRDITERKRAEESMRGSEARLRSMFEQSAVGIVHSSLDGAIEMANPKFCELSGYSREELKQIHYRDLTHAEDVGKSAEGRTRLLAGTLTAYERELRLLRKDGAELWAQVTTSVVRAEDERPAYFISVVNDIAERRAQQERIVRLSRMHAVQSGINALIVRVQTKEELFRDACRVAVEAGGFRLAWLGAVDREAKRVDPVAWSGAGEGFMRPLRRFLDEQPAGKRGLAEQAARDGKAFVSADMTRDPLIKLQREAREYGLHALAVLPLMSGGAVIGVFSLYAGEIGFFDAEEMALLHELAGDIAFALDSIEKREKLDYLAFYDPLTGLANRALFLERLKQSIHLANQGDSKFALAILDIERFRTINESLGRGKGDALIKLVAECLKLTGSAAGVGRISADHFALVLGEVRGRSQAGRIVEDALRKCFGKAFQVEGAELRLSAKAGVALYPGDAADGETLLANAEAALRKAKDLGERHVLYTPSLTDRSGGRLTLENQLRQALEKEEFVLHYQPKVDTETRAIVGVEALIRWQSPELGLVPPGRFIPLMEETGMILDAGAWALQQAARDHRKLFDLGLKPPRVAVNVSAIQLRQRDFVAAVERAIIDGIAPTGIDLEITESLIMEDVQSSIEKLKAARGLGVHIAIDDFGTGYSSLGYLAKLPVQTLKIDRSFVITMLGDPDTMTLVSTIISLAHSLRLKVVAEGVDKEEQAKMLRLLRCDEMQGYLFSKPVPFEQMTALLRQARPGGSGQP